MAQGNNQISKESQRGPNTDSRKQRPQMRSMTLCNKDSSRTGSKTLEKPCRKKQIYNPSQLMEAQTFGTKRSRRSSESLRSARSIEPRAKSHRVKFQDSRSCYTEHPYLKTTTKVRRAIKNDVK